MPTVGGPLEQQFVYMFSQQNGVRESFAIIPSEKAFVIGNSNQQVFENVPAFNRNATVNSTIQPYNQSEGQNLMGSIFSQGEFFIRIEEQTIPLHAELSDQYLVIDTYYR